MAKYLVQLVVVMVALIMLPIATPNSAYLNATVNNKLLFGGGEMEQHVKFEFSISQLFFFLATLFTFCMCIFGCLGGYPHRRLPPGPFQFPLIGNLDSLGAKPHRSLFRLSSEKYGPLMFLMLGRRATVVASSSEVAKLMLTDHDTKCNSRTVPSSIKLIGHHRLSVAWLPATDDKWNELRRTMTENFLSPTKLNVEAGQLLRREKLQNLSDYVRQCSQTGRAVDIGVSAFTTTLNLISASLFSVDFGPDRVREIKETMMHILRCAGTPNVTDFFPALERLDPQGIATTHKVHTQKLLQILEGIYDERVRRKAAGEATEVDLLQSLVDGTHKLQRADTMHLLLDMFIAGTDTTANTVEWAMAELVSHPEKIVRLRAEVNDFIRHRGRGVEESDISSLPYLDAVVKETLRLHPPAPFLVPRKADIDMHINGCLVPKNAQILINVWAMGRDPSVWGPDAESFSPERFLTTHADTRYIDPHMYLIPFGGGRRICPGKLLATRMLHLLLATLVGDFGWQLQQPLDMEEKYGLTLQKATPLVLIPLPLH